MAACGCETAIVGHCEERNDLAGILAEAKTAKSPAENEAAKASSTSESSKIVSAAETADAINRLLNQEIKRAIARGMSVLYCVGEKSEEQAAWQEVLGRQLETGLSGVDTSNVVIAYEPVWSIGPGKTPADKDYITKIARFIKERTDRMDIVYGGGLKQENAAMLASIEEIDGRLIALTRFCGDIGFYPEEYLEIVRFYLGM
jgi:triosephosphate isomerase